MLNYFQAIIFGFVQGFTEFFPISSSGHLVILHKLIALPLKNELAFDVALHVASLLALIFFFKTELWLLIKNWFLSFWRGSNNYSRLSWYIIIATIPAGLAALLFNDLITNIFRSPIAVAAMLALVGGLLLIIERVAKFKSNLNNLNWREALLIGCAQALALIPGTSRSGISIIAGLGIGLKREEAVKFSFLISVPLIALAAIKKTPSLFGVDLSVNDYGLLLVAFISAFITAWLAIKYFLRFARNHRLDIFAYYRFALALFIVIYFFL
jgi:undecaprenyl-diphosphatase